MPKQIQSARKKATGTKTSASSTNGGFPFPFPFLRAAALFPGVDTFITVGDSNGELLRFGDDAARYIRRMKRTGLWIWTPPPELLSTSKFQRATFDEQIVLYGEYAMQQIIDTLIQRKYDLITYPDTTEVQEHPFWSHAKFRKMLMKQLPATGSMVALAKPGHHAKLLGLPPTAAVTSYEERFGPVTDPTLRYMLERTRPSKGLPLQKTMALLPATDGFVTLVDADGKTVTFGDKESAETMDRLAVKDFDAYTRLWTTLKQVIMNHIVESCTRIVMLDPDTTLRFKQQARQYRDLWEALTGYCKARLEADPASTFRVECVDDDLK